MAPLGEHSHSFGASAGSSTSAADSSNSPGDSVLLVTTLAIRGNCGVIEPSSVNASFDKNVL